MSAASALVADATPFVGGGFAVKALRVSIVARFQRGREWRRYLFAIIVSGRRNRVCLAIEVAAMTRQNIHAQREVKSFLASMHFILAMSSACENRAVRPHFYLRFSSLHDDGMILFRGQCRAPLLTQYEMRILIFSRLSLAGISLGGISKCRLTSTGPDGRWGDTISRPMMRVAGVMMAARIYFYSMYQ